MKSLARLVRAFLNMPFAEALDFSFDAQVVGSLTDRGFTSDSVPIPIAIRPLGHRSLAPPAIPDWVTQHSLVSWKP